MTCNLKIHFLNDQTIYCPGQTLSGETKGAVCGVIDYLRGFLTGHVVVEIAEKCKFSGK